MVRKTARFTSENDFIRLLQDRFACIHPLLKKGIGDDAAVIHPKGADEYYIVTTDMLVENIDFHRRSIAPACLGYKSLAVNLSDLAAMGARPRFFTVSLAIPLEISRAWILRFFGGLHELGRSKGVFLIGGDLSRSDGGISISVTALGESVNRKVVYRSGGRAGDLLYVTGTLGKSAAGLKLLEKGNQHLRSRAGKLALLAHQKPEPRCEAGMWLAQSGLVHCMMDLSDGLSMDLPRICAASRVGAEIDVSKLPVFAECSAWGCDPVSLALHGGEDFELLFAVPALKADMLEQSYPRRFPKITRIGRLTRVPGVVKILEAGKDPIPLDQKGYNHFRASTFC